MTCSTFTRLRALAVGAVLVCPAAVRAHEKWFHDATSFPTDWGAVIRFPAILAEAVALATTALIWLWWRARRGRDLIPGPEVLGATDAGRARFYALVPLIVGIHIALPLIVLGIKGVLFSPNNALSEHWLYWLGTAQIGVGLCFLYGGMTRLGAIVLGAVWLLGVGVVGLESMLENLHVLGFVAFFWLAGRGPYAVDRLLFPALEPSPVLVRRAMVSLPRRHRGRAGRGRLHREARQSGAGAGIPANASAQLHPVAGHPDAGRPLHPLRRHDRVDHCVVPRLGIVPAVRHLDDLAVHQHDAHDLQLGRVSGALAALRSDGDSAGVDASRRGPARVGLGRTGSWDGE
jgi:hypothetical protein